MKHHLYSIYIGGAKTKLKNKYYCKQCGDIIHNATSHKKAFPTNDK